MELTRVDYRLWFIRVLGWDGLLPAVVATTPSAVGLLFPGNRGAIEITAVLLPIIAFLIRFQLGRNHIAQNVCSGALRRVQYSLFFVALLILLLFDAFVVLLHVMPNGGAFAGRGDRVIWTFLFVIYLSLMIVAMFPRRYDEDAVLQFLRQTMETGADLSEGQRLEVDGV